VEASLFSVKAISLHTEDCFVLFGRNGSRNVRRCRVALVQLPHFALFWKFTHGLTFFP
jgi:hypothetical protein